MGHPNGSRRPTSAQAALTMLAYLTDLISPDSYWKLRLAEIMDRQELDYLRLMGFPMIGNVSSNGV